MIRTRIAGIYYSFAGYSTEEIKKVYNLNKLVLISLAEFMQANNTRIIVNTMATRR